MRKVLLVVGVLALVAGNTQAQQRQWKRPGGLGGGAGGPGGGGPGGGAFSGGFPRGFLLNNESVQKELNLSDAQKTKLKEAVAKVNEDMKLVFAKLRDRETSREERMKLARKPHEAINEAIASVLDEKQLKRLKQIELQRSLQDPGGFYHNDELEKDLKLSADQKKQIEEIAIASLKKMGTIGFGDRESKQELLKETREKVNGVLTDEQKKTLKELQGTPFKFELRPRNNDKTDK